MTANRDRGNWRPHAVPERRAPGLPAEEHVAKPEWGTKRICQACGAKFYDLRRSPIVCPACGVEFDPEALLRSRRSRAPGAKDDEGKKAAAKKAAVEKAAPDKDEEAFDADLEDEDLDDTEDMTDEDGDEAVIEDASELGEDEEDLSDVKVKDGDSEER